jgi:hypothetical protein
MVSEGRVLGGTATRLAARKGRGTASGWPPWLGFNRFHAYMAIFMLAA